MNIESNKFISDKKLSGFKKSLKFNKVLSADKKIFANKFLKASKYKPYSELFKLICENMKISLNNDYFVYFLDFTYLFDATRGYRFENLTVDYSKILDNGILSLKYFENECTSKFTRDYNQVIDSLVLLIKRIIKELEKSKVSNYEEKILWFKNMLDKPAKGFSEAIQRILFINQMLWQTTHYLNGLGDLDTKLYKYFENDYNSGEINDDTAIYIIKEFYKTLHRYYWYKSNVLLGDTGQVLVLGKSKIDGSYYCNKLTYLFIKVLKELCIPDPKVVLRVSKNTPDDLLKLSLECISTGVGAPLFANDEVILPALTEFGIKKEDAYNYVTSACWEPLIGGKSSSLNNQTCLNYMRALDNLIKRENLSNIKDFDTFKLKYFEYLGKNITAIKRVLNNNKLQYDPLLSIFIDDCKMKKKDVSAGGARYHHVGITSVGLSNTVNALINVKKFVFEDSIFSLTDVRKLVATNFRDNKQYQELLKYGDKKYGNDDKEVIDLVNEIMQVTTDNTSDFQYYLGGKLKYGLSAPSYIDAARGFLASFDGRGKGEPFNVHISSDMSSAYTELMNFAGSLDYTDNRFNGNVVDFMVAPSFLANNFDKFIDFLKSSIKVGFFEMQINVISSEILIDAKKNPDKFPNLIVRVWGFSAYFNDLPEEYKNVLIERALKNEGKR